MTHTGALVAVVGSASTFLVVFRFLWNAIRSAGAV